MATELDIKNSALIKLGSNTYSSVDEVGTNEGARLMERRYPFCRDYVLSRHAWQCATKRVTLSPDTETPDSEWENQFTLPTDFLRLDKVINLTNLEFETEGNKILADEETLQISYIFRQTDTSTYTGDLPEIIAWYLAYDVSMAITSSLRIRKECMNSYKDALAKAQYINSANKSRKRMMPTEFNDARRYWGG